jgi:hypothetical protein
MQAILWMLIGCLALVPAAGTQTRERAEPDKSAKAADKDSGATTKLRLEVVAGEKDEPVDSASVYVKYTRERSFAKDEKIEVNTKTNRSGVATIQGVPRGKILVQVIAQGWKTFGQWYDADKTEQTIRIKLQKPTRWY